MVASRCGGRFYVLRKTLVMDDMVVRHVVCRLDFDVILFQRQSGRKSDAIARHRVLEGAIRCHEARFRSWIFGSRSCGKHGKHNGERSQCHQCSHRRSAQWTTSRSARFGISKIFPSKQFYLYKLFIIEFINRMRNHLRRR